MLAAAAPKIGAELGTPSAVDFIVETRDVVFTCRAMPRPTVQVITDLLRKSGCKGVYVAGTTRGGRSLPPPPGANIRQGDELQLYGRPQDVARAAKLLGTAEKAQQ